MSDKNVDQLVAKLKKYKIELTKDENKSKAFLEVPPIVCTSSDLI